MRADAPAPSQSPTSRLVAAAEVAIVLAACGLILKELAPPAIVCASLPVGTDFTGHAVGVWIDRTSPSAVLPGGWSMASFGGYPANQLYPSLATAVAALLSFVIPLGSALKITAVLPLVLLPLVMWVALRTASMPRSIAVAAAVGVVPFAFDTSCSLCGGSIASTVRGEYAYAWGIALGVLALGLADRWLSSGKGTVVTGLVICAALLAHPVTAVWTAASLVVLAALLRRAWWGTRRGQLGLLTLAITLMALTWWLPFLWRREWMPLLAFPKRTDYLYWLLPASTLWELVVLASAVFGTVIAVRRQWWIIVTLAATGVVAAGLFVAIPEGSQLFNVRVLPIWYLARWVLAAVGWSAAVLWSMSKIGASRRPAMSLVPAFSLLVTALVVVGTTWGWWGVSRAPTADTAGRSVVADVEITVQAGGAGVVFGGFDIRPDAVALHEVQSMLVHAGAQRGCGRLAWDIGTSADPSRAAFGDAETFWQAPVWTDGCITSMTGVYVDSSATTPAAYGLESLVSQTPGADLPAVQLYALDLLHGVPRLAAFGVRYYMSQSPDLAQTPGLTRVSTAGGWSLYEVSGSSIVSDLTSSPVVVDPRPGDGDWAPLTMRYAASSLYDSVALVQDGPAAWPRVSPDSAPPVQPIAPAGVHDVTVTDTSVTFNVAHTGRPVMIKVSDFPGWSAEGAAEVYRASPNFMVVVPESNHVTLVHRRTAVDAVATASGVAGISLLTLLAVKDRRRRGADQQNADVHADPVPPERPRSRARSR